MRLCDVNDFISDNQKMALKNPLYPSYMKIFKAKTHETGVKLCEIDLKTFKQLVLEFAISVTQAESSVMRACVNARQDHLVRMSKQGVSDGVCPKNVYLDIAKTNSNYAVIHDTAYVVVHDLYVESRENSPHTVKSALVDKLTALIGNLKKLSNKSIYEDRLIRNLEDLVTFFASIVTINGHQFKGKIEVFKDGVFFNNDK